MRNVGLSYSKLRNHLGAVGVRVTNNRIAVEYARRWPAEKVNDMANDLAFAYSRVKWNSTYADQLIGEFAINLLRRRALPTSVITTNKLSKNAKDIEKIKVMDKIEMSEFVRKLKINEQLRFPTKPSIYIKELEEQLPMFSKHTTEAGSVDYYAPGEEPDELVRGLLIACFSVRNQIDSGGSTLHVLGPVKTAESHAAYRRHDTSYYDITKYI